MKAFYLISFICLVVFISVESKAIVKRSHETLKNGQNNHTVCRTKDGVPIENLFAKLNDSSEELEETEVEITRTEIGCYLYCLFQERGVFNGTVVNVELFGDTLKQGADMTNEAHRKLARMIDDILEGCVRQVKNITDTCALGWDFSMCLGDIVGLK